MKSSTKNNAEGKMHQVKGKIKEAIGKIAGDRDLKIEGENENLDGKAQEELGRIEKVIGN
ncbi:MAG: CsbD family protein [Pseudomonadota bacterium]